MEKALTSNDQIFKRIMAFERPKNMRARQKTTTNVSNVTTLQSVAPAPVIVKNTKLNHTGAEESKLSFFHETELSS